MSDPSISLTNLAPHYSPPWFPGEPNGQDFENCVVFWPDEGAWNDENCGTEVSLSIHRTKKNTVSNVSVMFLAIFQFCFFCDLERSPEFFLRGLPPKSKFDSRFAWTGKIKDGR